MFLSKTWGVESVLSCFDPKSWQHESQVLDEDVFFFGPQIGPEPNFNLGPEPNFQKWFIFSKFAVSNFSETTKT